MTSKQQNPINELFQIFTNSVTKTLGQSLDKETCKKIEYAMVSSSSVQRTDNLEENNAIYKIDYATGNRQGTLVILFPEVLFASIADIIMGGSGDEKYKGTLSELETNSITELLDKIFKNIESDFKRNYNQDLAFSTTPMLLLKEMPDYSIHSDDLLLDFMVRTTLSLNEGKDFNVNMLLTRDIIEGLMDDLGLKKPVPSSKKIDTAFANINRIADVKINITAELGRTQVPIKYALELVRGSLIELDTLNNADIKVFANGIEFAHAQVVAVEDSFGLKITKIISPEERLETI